VATPGEAVIAVRTAAAQEHRCKASTFSGMVVTNPANPRSFELAAGASIQIFSQFQAPLLSPNAGDVQVFVGLYQDTTATLVKADRTLQLNPGWATGTVHNGAPQTYYATHDGTATGIPMGGTYRVVIAMLYGQVNGDAVNGNYNANSDNQITRTGSSWAISYFEQGYVRAGIPIVAVDVDTVTVFDGLPALLAYADPFHMRITSGVVLLPAHTAGQAGTYELTSGVAGNVLAGLSGQIPYDADSQWQSGALTVPKLDATAPDTLGVRFAPGNSTLSGRPRFHITAAPAGWTLGGNDGGLGSPTGAASIHKSAAMPYSSAVTLDQVTITTPATTAESILNRGEKVTGTVRLRNARGEGFDPIVTHELRVRDAADGADETVHTLDPLTITGTGTTPRTITFGVTFSTTPATAAGNRATESTAQPPTDLGSSKLLRYRDGDRQPPAVLSPQFGRLSQTYEVRRHLQVNQRAPIDATQTEDRLSRLTSDLGFVTLQVRNRRGQARAGVALPAGQVLAIRDDTDLVNQISGTPAPTTDAAGYFPVVAWDSQLPSGRWDVWIATSSANGAGNGAITPHNGNTAAFNRKATGSSDLTLLAVDPFLRVLTNAGPGPADGTHWSPGRDLLVGVALFDATVDNLIQPDTGSAYVQLGHFDDDTGTALYFAPVLTALGGGLFAVTGGTWEVLGPDDAAARIPLIPADVAVAGGDPRVYVTTILGAITATWRTGYLFVIGGCTKDGTPYYLWNTVEGVGAANPHHAYAFDPTGLFR
jgi:hypothetical protein